MYYDPSGYMSSDCKQDTSGRLDLYHWKILGKWVIKMKELFIGHGIQIIKRSEKYYLIYDAGEICDRMEEIEITRAEVELAKKSSMDAYNIIIKYQNEMVFGTKN